MKKRSLLPVLLALAMVLTMIPASVFADGDDDANTVYIDSNEDLVNAITNQQDGQTWIFTKEGTYDAKNTAEGSAGNYSVPAEVYAYPFALPLYADNLTITKAEGVGQIILTSSYEPAAASGGNWHDQNFITVYGSALTIDGIDIKANRNLYYGTCNKAIELTGGAKTFTLKNVNIIPVENDEGTSFGGSIYFSVTDAGNTLIQNVTMDAWISAGNVNTGTVKIDNLVQDFSNSEYAGYSYDGAYSWNPVIKGDNVTVTNHKVIVDGKTDLIKQVFNDNLRENTVIELAGDVEIDSMLTIKTSGVTLDLNNHKITASEDFTSTFANDSHLLNIEGDDVTVKNGTLTATEKNKHVLNVYNAEGFTAENLTLDHSKANTGAPLVVNNSDVIVKGNLDLITGENSWYGINVDSKGGKASLEFAEGSKVQMTGKEGLKVMTVENSDEGEVPVIKGAENAGLMLNEDGTYEEAYDVSLIINYVTESGKNVAKETFTEKSAAGKFKWIYNENYQINIPAGYEFVEYDGIYETMEADVVAGDENITEGNVIVKASQTAGTTDSADVAKPDSSAKTGDDFNMAIPFAAAGLALAALAAVVATRKRHN